MGDLGRLERSDNVFTRDVLGLRHRTQDGIKCANAQRAMVGHCHPVMLRRFGLQNDVAADLVDLAITPLTRERGDQLPVR